MLRANDGCTATPALARRKERLEKLLEARPWDLVLVDEAHHARRSWSPGRGQTNQMLRLLEKLRQHTCAMQLMTATPMQIDVRELWELLRLCGMEGRWAARNGDDFQQYFLTLQHESWPREDLAYLLDMSHAYFADGGQPDEQLKQQFCEHSNGGHTLWHQLTRSLAPADPADIYSKLQAHAARGMRELMADFFRRHTPVRRYMFRHTRDTLRHYRSQGLLAEKIPVRKVSDRFIPLGPAQEPYDQIEEYISEKYRKAEAEKRSALGYVMTIYRQRLTSSPRAISETLQRRLESNLGQLEERVEALLEVDIDEYIEDFGEIDETQRVMSSVASSLIYTTQLAIIRKYRSHYALSDRFLTICHPVNAISGIVCSIALSAHVTASSATHKRKRGVARRKLLIRQQRNLNGGCQNPVFLLRATTLTSENDRVGAPSGK
jgi:hypothetical protein